VTSARFIRSQKRMPDTGLRSNDAQWDFWTRHTRLRTTFFSVPQTEQTSRKVSSF
jgi:catalase